jgi:hypothetical protein
MGDFDLMVLMMKMVMMTMLPGMRNVYIDTPLNVSRQIRVKHNHMNARLDRSLKDIE